METCAVCDRSGVVAHHTSGMAPVSFQRCAPCTERNAEPLGVVLTWIFLSGGSAAAAVHGFHPVSFEADHYVGWDAITQLYEARKHEIAALFDEDSDLVEDT